ncbi:MAG: glycosyltransferase family 4 protein [Phycisphaerales bacterium]|jgi:glycosyltransferase involved in cell wall biosynthesis|nr:glycosyltransferase family 4 protein [Phycisphaerales bacterium]
MHIVYIHQYFTTPDQKGGTRSYEMARRLIQAGHRVSMVFGTRDLTAVEGKLGEVQRETIDGIDVFRIIQSYSNAMSFPKRWMTFLKFAKRATKLIKTFQDVDLVFATSTPLTTGDIGRKSAKHHNCPFVFEVRDLWPELPIAMGLVKPWPLKVYLKRMEQRAYRAAKRIIGLAPGICKGILASGVNPDHVAMVPNSSDIDLFQPATDHSEVDNDPRFGSPGDFRMVFTGAHGLANGLDAVLDAVAEIKQRGITGVKFCFIGGGGKKPHLLQRVEAEGLEEYTCWVDPIKKRELARLLPQFDVGMMILKNVPAFYRGTSPNKFFDYLACGLPILNNYPGWVGEYISDNQCGVVVEPDNATAFADTVEELMAKRSELPAMGTNARALAESTFSRDILGKRFVETLEAAAEK